MTGIAALGPRKGKMLENCQTYSGRLRALQGKFLGKAYLVLGLNHGWET